MFYFSTQVHPVISKEEEDFLQIILAISLGKRSWTNPNSKEQDAQAHLHKFSFSRPLPILVRPLPIDLSMLTCWLVFLFQR